MLLVIGRTFKEALSNFMRNGWLSVAAITVLFLSLYVVSFLVIATKTADGMLKNIQDKVNVSVYFKSDVPEQNILDDKEEMDNWPLVKSVEYISRDQALANFKRDNADEPVIMKSLDVLGDNPLLASLVVKADSSADYEAVIAEINQSSFKDDVSRVNYQKNKDKIDSLNRAVGEIKKVGLALAGIFGFIAVLITFNTIRITIYTHRKEIEVMRLVGASNTFIRLPFIFEGVIYAVIAMLLSSILLLITLQFIMPHVTSAISSGTLVSVFMSNLPMVIAVQLLISVFLGTISSMIAIRRYLKF